MLLRVGQIAAFFALLVFCAVSVFAEACADKPSHFSRVEIADTAGGEVVLPVPGKKATVLVFLSCDCPIANAFAPELGRIYGDYGEQDVAFYRVYADLAQGLDDIAEHAKEYGHRFPAIRDVEQELVKRSGARITPEVVVLDAEGNIAYRGRINDLYADIGKRRRQATTADLRDALDAVLSGKPVKTPETRAFGCYIPLAFDETGEDAPTG